MNKLLYMPMTKIFCFIFIILLVFGIVWLKSNVISLEYKISSLEKKKVQLMKENKVIIAQKARLLALERFENNEARGFVFPDRIRVVYIQESSLKEPYRISHQKGQ